MGKNFFPVSWVRICFTNRFNKTKLSFLTLNEVIRRDLTERKVSKDTAKDRNAWKSFIRKCRTLPSMKNRRYNNMIESSLPLQKGLFLSKKSPDQWTKWKRNFSTPKTQSAAFKTSNIITSSKVNWNQWKCH